MSCGQLRTSPTGFRQIAPATYRRDDLTLTLLVDATGRLFGVAVAADDEPGAPGKSPAVVAVSHPARQIYPPGDLFTIVA